MDIDKWMKKWNIPIQAMHEISVISLLNYYETHTERSSKKNMSEAEVSQQIRLCVSKNGGIVFRNNVGGWLNEKGRFVRYGLGNDSKQLNRVLKSHDLIGITPVNITSSHVGKRLGVFTSYEAKHSSWVYGGTEREQAQKKWMDLIINLGGISKFITNIEEI